MRDFAWCVLVKQFDLRYLSLAIAEGATLCGLWMNLDKAGCVTISPAFFRRWRTARIMQF